LSKGSVLVTFDREMRPTNGSVSGIKLLVNESPAVYNNLSGPLYGKKVEINEFHKILGHWVSDKLEKITKIHDLKLNGEFKTCEQYAIDKARHNSNNKDCKDEIQVHGEWLYLDISSFKDLRYGGFKFWALIVDDYTDYSRSIFLKNKGESKNMMFILLTDLNISGINVKVIFYDDSGEKMSAYMTHVEQTGTISSLNSRVWEFPTQWWMIRVTLKNGGLEDSVRTGEWSDCARTTTLLSNIISIKGKDKCSYRLMFGRKPNLPTGLRIFGEMGVVNTKYDIKGKLKTRGLNSIFLG
jgi:hypothetical protein